jgi:DNA-binding GntR family transcriptional regulator
MSLMDVLEAGHVYTAGSIREITGMSYCDIMSELRQLETEGRVEIERHRGRQGCTAVRVIG